MTHPNFHTRAPGAVDRPRTASIEEAYADANEHRVREVTGRMTDSAVYAALLLSVVVGFGDPARLALPILATAGFATGCRLMRGGLFEVGRAVAYLTAAATVAGLIASYGFGNQAHLLLAPLVLAGCACFELTAQRMTTLAIAGAVFGLGHLMHAGALPVDLASPAPTSVGLSTGFVLLVTVLSSWMVDDLLCVNREFRGRAHACVLELERRHTRLGANRESLREQAAFLTTANEALARELALGESIQRQLRANNELLEQFVFAASHDLKEPLRSIASFMQLVRRKVGSPDGELGEYFDFVVAASARMTRLLDGLLAYSRAGKAEPAPAEWVDLDRVLVMLRYECAPALASTGGSINPAGAASLGKVYVDRAALQHILRQLLDNATKFARPGTAPEVTIERLRRANGATVLRVRDRGIGVEPEFRERVFQLFQRLGHVDDYEGAGVGLALVRKLAASHGMQVRLADSADGVGICAEVELPPEGLAVVAPPPRSGAGAEGCRDVAGAVAPAARSGATLSVGRPAASYPV